MFIKLDTVQDGSLDVNVSQITYIQEHVVYLSNGGRLALTEKSYKELKASIYGDGIEASPKASAHTEDLLNNLNKLLGGRGPAKPTTDRKARLKARLKDFSEDELKAAAKNLGNDEFMQGANEQNKRYGTIDYLLRTSTNVNKWLEETQQKKKGMF